MKFERLEPELKTNECILELICIVAEQQAVIENLEDMLATTLDKIEENHDNRRTD
jgi:uncharacterized coiled-coil protein SlyX